MKLFSKRTTLLALVLAVLMVFAACAPTAPGPDNSGNSGEVTVKKPEDIKIFVEHFSKTVEVAMQWRQGALRAGEELGIQVDVNGAEDASAEKNIALLQQAIAQEYDGIASIALVSDSYGAVYDEAAARGIPVMTYHMDAPDSERVAYFGPNQQSYAQAAARFMADEMGKEGKVITIQGTPSDTEAMIIDEFEAELKRYAPNCTVVTKINDTVDPAKAYEKITAAVQSNKDVKGFFSCTSRGGADAVQVCDDLGIKPVSIVTMDVVSYNVDLLKEGKITGIVDQGAFNDGYMAVKALYELLTTGELKEYKEGINYLPDVIVSKANLAEYEPLIQEALDMQKEQMESAE